MNVSAWIEHLPQAWRVLPLKYVAEISNSSVDKKSYADGIPVRLCNYTDVYYNDYITSAMDMMHATATSSEVRRFSLRRGDVIITKDSESWTDIAVPSCVADDLEGVICGYHLTMMRPWPDVIHGPFLLRCLQASGVREQLWTAANGVTRFGLGQQGIRDALVPLPSVAVQRAIADFLDRKTAAIDALIDRKDRLIALLAEKRAAIIHRAVTKGLPSDGPMKDSGIPWIGEIPVHWDVVRLKFIVSHTVDCHHSTPIYDEDAPYPALRTSDVSPGRLDVAGARRVHEGEYLRRISRLKPQPQDVIYSREGERWGMAALVPNGVDLCLAQRVMLFRPRPNIRAEFLMWALNSTGVYHQLALRVVGATSPHVNIGDIREVWVPLPPKEEQAQLVELMEKVLGNCNAQEAALRSSLDRLREYRQALITAAVTGQLDIGEP